jgi:hypothetical protein
MECFEELFAGYECLAITNGTLMLHALKNAGPRITGLQVGNGANLMAEVPYSGEKSHEFIPRGGQRLWHAPEDAVRTYVSDNQPVEFKVNSSSVMITQNIEKETCIQKSIEIELPDGQASAKVQYALQNHNLWPVTLAAWPICQMRVGGFAILPQSTRQSGLLPNRRLVIWPYTDIQSKNISIANRYIFVQARYQDSQKGKLGWLNERGWMGYYLDRTLIIKKAAFNPDAEYVDFGCSMECYCDERFLEMETLSPLTTIQPGKTLFYHEEWIVVTDIDLSANEDCIDEVIKDLKL